MKATAFYSRLLLLAVLGAVMLYGTTLNAQGIDVTPAEAKEMVDSASELTIIDVSPAYANGHIPGALSYPLDDGSFDAAIAGLVSDDSYLIYCHTDAASNSATQKLADAGFKSVYRLTGNFGAWQAAGYPVGTPGYTDISAAEAKTWIETDPDVTTIDVSPVYNDGHLPGAISYTLSETLDTVIPHLDKNGKFLVYCHSDGASMSGAQKLIDAGFTRVKRLEGNYAAWTGAGYTVEQSTGSYGDLEAGESFTLKNTTPDLVTIDVSPAYAGGHIAGALSYPLGDGSLDAALATLDRNAEYLVYCHTDAASQAGAQKLVDTGFANVSRLAGNFGAWQTAGYPVETPAYTDITVAAAKTTIENDPEVTVIDVSPAYKAGHLPGAVSYPLSETLDAVIPHLDNNGKFLVYCHSDGASMSGAQKLVDAGFTRVQRLEGNFSAWSGAGNTVTPSPPAYRDATPAAAKDLIETVDGLTVIDVSPVYDDGHIPGAISLSLGDGTLDATIPELDKNGAFLVYCHTDEASQTGAEKLIDAGIANVFRLRGNFGAWVEAGFDVEVQTSVGEQTPASFSLEQPFPNPFNPTTTIQFTIPAELNVSLVVYDLLGRKVAEPVNGFMDAGSHSATWDGTDVSGNLLGSGIYFYRLTAGANTAHGKITFLR